MTERAFTVSAKTEIQPQKFAQIQKFGIWGVGQKYLFHQNVRSNFQVNFWLLDKNAFWQLLPKIFDQNKTLSIILDVAIL